MLSKVFSATILGLNVVPITVESNADAVSDVGRFVIVGLPDSAVRESQERVRTALKVNGYKVPLRDTVVNLAPADVRKEGSGFDLPIAVSLMVTYGFLMPETVDRSMFIGELGLDGTILPAKGVLPIAIKARADKYDALFVPEENAREAAVVDNLKVYGVHTLKEVVSILEGHSLIRPTEVNTREEFYAAQSSFDVDFSDVRGQENVKRAFEVAAAGGHNILLIGSPGCGKSMMAKRLPTILPPLTLSESLETTQIHSIAGALKRDSALISQRPFRAPHHTVSDVALVGGGAVFTPGEISLAHNGVLFLDEMPEFSRFVLETLRQPLEDRQITISRAKYTYTLPCSFMLVASMNPCPCGYLHHPTHPCVCSPGQVQRYMSKISGPLLDRIDLQVEVESVPLDKLVNASSGEPSASIRERVTRARQIQTERYKGIRGVFCNAQMPDRLVHEYANPDESGVMLLQKAMEHLNLSARAYNRIVKMARTIADLEWSPVINHRHVSEAIGYRNLDRKNWAE